MRGVLALAVCAAAFAPSSASASSACPGDDAVPTTATTSQATLELVCDIDTVRVRNGLPILRWNATLGSMAQWMANELAASSTFSHVAPDGEDLYDRGRAVGYLPATSTGFLLENLGWETGPDSAPLDIALAWLASDRHRRNILDPEIEDIGAGVAQGAATAGGATGWFYVVDFGRQSTLTARSATRPHRHSARRRSACTRMPARRSHHTRRSQYRRVSRCTPAQNRRSLK